MNGPAAAKIDDRDQRYADERISQKVRVLVSKVRVPEIRLR
jgi:hypothetical protein